MIFKNMQIPFKEIKMYLDIRKIKYSTLSSLFYVYFVHWRKIF